MEVELEGLSAKRKRDAESGVLLGTQSKKEMFLLCIFDVETVQRIYSMFLSLGGNVNGLMPFMSIRDEENATNWMRD